MKAKLLTQPKRLCKWLLLLLVLAGAAYGGWTWQQSRGWHEFEKAADKAPQAYVQMSPDFQYHIGDVVPVTLFIKQQAGTSVDLKEGLTLRGDFEIRKAGSWRSYKQRDGAVLYRIDLELQCVETKHQRVFGGEIAWTDKDSGKSDQFKIPPATMYGSNTWDGRKELQEGETPAVSVYPGIALNAAALLASGAIFFWLALRQFKEWRRKRMLTNPEKLLAHLEAIWARIESGERSPKLFEQVELIVRQRWGLESVLFADLSKLATTYQERDTLGRFFELSELAIYSQQELDAEEIAGMKRLSIKLVKDSFARKDAPPVPGIVPEPGAAAEVPV